MKQCFRLIKKSDLNGKNLSNIIISAMDRHECNYGTIEWKEFIKDKDIIK